jgi:hypothetical protein
MENNGAVEHTKIILVKFVSSLHILLKATLFLKNQRSYQGNTPKILASE